MTHVNDQGCLGKGCRDGSREARSGDVEFEICGGTEEARGESADQIGISGKIQIQRCTEEASSREGPRELIVGKEVGNGWHAVKKRYGARKGIITRVNPNRH